jgi:hypothetical protein
MVSLISSWALVWVCAPAPVVRTASSRQSRSGREAVDMDLTDLNLRKPLPIIAGKIQDWIVTARGELRDGQSLPAGEALPGEISTDKITLPSGLRPSGRL